MIVAYVGLGVVGVAAIGLFLWRVFGRYSLWDGDLNQTRRRSDSDESV